MNQYKIAAIFLGGAVLGGAGTYWAVHGQLKDKFESRAEAEIADVKDHYKIIHSKKDQPTPGDALAQKKVVETKEVSTFPKKDYLKKVSQYQIETERDESKSGVEERSVFDYTGLGKTEGKDMTDRSEAYPVTFEEFDTENLEYTKTTLTYFQGDDTVSDEEDDIIEDVIGVIGSKGLGSFGYDPDHPHTAYIRNDHLQSDFEVIIDERTYREVVIGN